MNALLAPRHLESVLREELGTRAVDQHGRLFVVNDDQRALWAQNTWFDVQRFQFKSISEAVRHLRGIQRNWALHSVAAHRRAKLIQEQLPVLKPKRVVFPSPLPAAPLGSWTLLDENTMLFAASCSSPFVDGEPEFEENKNDPPSRAYLKLWEHFTLQGRWPTTGEKVLDLGSSPGGWTWVLDQLGCDVVSVDKAPLAESLKLSGRVRYLEQSAFALEPREIGKVDWLFSDIICYPERLLELVRKWRPFAANMVCTIKCQEPTNHAIIQEFLKIPESRCMHLFNNKHELTWFTI